MGSGRLDPFKRPPYRVVKWCWVRAKTTPLTENQIRTHRRATNAVRVTLYCREVRPGHAVSSRWVSRVQEYARVCDVAADLRVGRGQLDRLATPIRRMVQKSQEA